MVKQPKILEHDSDAQPHLGDLPPREGTDIAAEEADQAAGRPQGQVHHPQKRGLAGAARPEEEVEGPRRQREADLAENLGPRPIAQQHLVENDQAASSLPDSKGRARMAQGPVARKAAPLALAGPIGIYRQSMARTSHAFDRSGRLVRPTYRRLAAEAWSQVSYNPSPPDHRRLPRGNGHVVLVIPAFLTSDAITGPLRRFLQRCGYRAFGWQLGVNWGPTPRILELLRRRLDECCDLEGGPVSVIGLSLGGLLARDLAHDRPQDIDHLVTIVSPYRLPTASHLEPFFHVLAPF